MAKNKDSLILKTLHLFNIHSTRRTKKKDIKFLLDNLRPLSCKKELIRLGHDGDGGYLVPDDLVGIEACFSPGVDRVSGFELDCANLGMKVFLADKSVEAPTITHSSFNFTRKHIGATTDRDFTTIDDWVSSSLPASESDLLLQIDIENFEYEVVLGMSEKLLKRSRIIVVEFHSLQELWNRPFFNLASRAFQKLLQTHSCVHIHPNNCLGSIKRGEIEIPLVTEFTFLRKDRIKNSSFATAFPHPLDFDNTKNASLPLPKCWYG